MLLSQMFLRQCFEIATPKILKSLYHSLQLPPDNQLSNRLFSGSAQKGKNIQKFRNFFKDLGKPKLRKLWASIKTDF